MPSRARRIAITTMLAGAIVSLNTASAVGSFGDDSDHTPENGYSVMARDGRLVNEVSGEVQEDVQGVPARPVHAFNWDGPVEEINGSIRIDVDPEANTGKITAKWTDRNGRWQLTQTVFTPPDHPAGLRLGPSATETTLVEDDAITTDVYLHGDTTAGGPVLPTLFNDLATWGPADVKLNGEPFLNPYDGPAPRWATHSMTSIGTRLPDGTVTANSGADIYNPQFADSGDTQPEDTEVHLVFHDAPGPETVEGNFPPTFSFFYHVMFEEVQVKIDAR